MILKRLSPQFAARMMVQCMVPPWSSCTTCRRHKVALALGKDTLSGGFRLGSPRRSHADRRRVGGVSFNELPVLVYGNDGVENDAAVIRIVSGVAAESDSDLSRLPPSTRGTCGSKSQAGTVNRTSLTTLFRMWSTLSCKETFDRRFQSQRR